MPVPSPRNSIRIARGNFADLSANSTAFGDGEFIYAIDQDRFYSADGGVLFPVGRGVISVESIDVLADVDTSTIAPGVGSVLKWDGTNWVPSTDENTDAVTSVNTQTGDVVLDADDISDAATTNKFATQTELDKLANIEAGAQVNTVDSVAGKTGDVTLVKADVGLANVDNTSDANKPVSTAQQTALDAKADLVGGVVPASQIPSIAITEYLGAVASEAAMLALTGQEGDWCNRTDTSSTFVITGSDPSVIGSWTELSYPVDAVTSVNTQTGAVVLGPSDVGAATAAQGLLADSAVQPTDSIDVLADVDISTTAPTDGQALIWDNAGGKFVPGEAGLVDSVNGATGDVVLDTDDISEGSTNLYSQWDNATGGINYASGNVGIGTSSPLRTLHVAGAGDTGLMLQTTNAVNDKEIWEIQTAGDASNHANLVFRSRTNAGTGGTEALRITNDGKVGIGTTSPTSAQLYVNSSETYGVRINHATLPLQSFLVNGTQAFSIGANSGGGGSFYYGAGNLTAATIDSSGRLLVGTSTSRVVEDLPGNGPQGLIQIEATNSDAIMSIISAGTADAGRAGTLSLGRHRNSTVGGTPTIVQNGDTLGAICFAGGDGTDMRTKGASIAAQVDGTPGVDDMPGRLVFSTTADGASSPTERMRIDSSGRLLVGTSSARSVGGNITGNLYVEGNSVTQAVVINNENSATGPSLRLGKSRGTANGSNTLVQDDDNLGAIIFAGADGTDLVSSGAVIKAEVDGTPGANDMPGRLVFSTTADGASSPTERMRIDSSGRLLVGTSSAPETFGGTLLQVVDEAGATAVLGRDDSTVAADNALGSIYFNTKAGGSWQESATIRCFADAAQGTGDVPSRLEFSTTADGASSPTERMRIRSDGNIGIFNTPGFYPNTDNAAGLGFTGFRWAAVYAVNGTIQTSDQRDKAEIIDASLGADFIKALRPVSYKWIEGGKRDTGEQDDDGNFIYEPVPGARTHWGFIAQEVKQAVDAAGVDFGGWVLTDKDDPDSQQALRYDQFIAPLTKALQEALAEIDILKAKVAALEAP